MLIPTKAVLYLLNFGINSLIRLFQRRRPARQLRKYIPVCLSDRLVDANLIATALKSLLRCNNCLPGKQLLHDLEACLFDARIKVHRLVGDAELVGDPLDLGIAARFVSRLSWGICVHAVVNFVFDTVQGVRPSFHTRF